MKSIFLFIAFLFAFTFSSFADEIDSLEQIVKVNAQDTNTVNALNLLCKKNWSSEQEKALEYGSRGLKLAQKINFKKGEAQALNNIGVAYYNFSDYNKALEFHYRALEIRKALGDSKDIAASYNNIGNAYDGKSDYRMALDYFSKALELREEIHDEKGIAGTSNNMGNLCYSYGDYYKAIEYFLTALKIYEKSGETSEAHANVLHNIGNVYREQKDDKNALEFYEKGLKMREAIEDEQGIGESYNALAAVYLATAQEQKNSTYAEENYSKARKYYKNALEIQEKIEDRANMAITLTNLGIIYRNDKNYEMALKESFSALSIAEEIEDKSTVAAALQNISEIYKEQNKIDTSLLYASRALALGDSLHYLEVIKTSHQTLSDDYALLKQYDKSLEHYKLYTAYRDSLLNSENAKQISNMQNKFELEQEKLKEEHARQAEEEHHHQVEQAQYLVIVGIIIILLMFIVIASHMQLSVKTIDYAAFVGVLLFFQFLEVMLHPIINHYAHGLPMVFILINIALISTLKPIHHYVEKGLLKVSHKITHRKLQLIEHKKEAAERKRKELEMMQANNNPENNS